MITNADLKSQTRRELAEIARNYGVSGWHGMRKDDLIAEIKKVQRRLRRKSAKAAAAPTASSPKATAKPKTTTKPASRSSTRRKPKRKVDPVDLTKPKISAKTARIRAEMRRRRELSQQRKDLSTGTLVAGSAVTDGAEHKRGDAPHRDRVVLVVRDSFWLQASWEIMQSSVQRAQSALAERWHAAQPVLRVLTVGDSSSNRDETVDRDIPIHGGVSNWYVDVQDPPSRYRVAVGYLADNGEFHCLCRSNVVETPSPGDCKRLDEHWHDIAEDYERIYALSGGLESSSDDLREMFEDRLQRSMPHRSASGSTVGDPSLLRQSKLKLDVDAELIVFGKTDPTASVMVSGRPVKLQRDGAFTVRLEFADKRQVLPVTAETRDGMRQRTTVIAVERNTKVMDTVELQENV
ncbi:MAG: DUF4912 domain-containing protein [Planctomycetota bacterium]